MSGASSSVTSSLLIANRTAGLALLNSTAAVNEEIGVRFILSYIYETEFDVNYVLKMLHIRL